MEETKKKKENGFQSFLPDDVLFNLFLLLPDETLQVTRYVCRQWYNVITNPIFVDTHLQQSTTGLFVKYFHCLESPQFLEIVKGVITMKKLNFWGRSHIMDCCDGVILCREYKHILHVANPLTCEKMTLPEPPMTMGIDRGGAIARCPSTGRFKVLHRYYDREWVIQCKIITVGVDKEWRPTVHAKKYIASGQLLGIGGFFYQVSSALTYVVILDLEDETVSRFAVPKEIRSGRCFCRAMGNLLSVTNICFDNLQSDVWAVTDCKKGIWTKLYKINLEAHTSMFKRNILCRKMVVWDWVDNGNVVIFSIPKSYGSKENYITHNIKTGEFTIGTTSIQVNHHFCRAHVNSLVSLKDH